MRKTPPALRVEHAAPTTLVRILHPIEQLGGHPITARCSEAAFAALEDAIAFHRATLIVTSGDTKPGDTVAVSRVSPSLGDTPS